MVTREGQGIMSDGEETPLSVVRPYGMGVPPNEALGTSGSPHLTIGYLLRIECGDLESLVENLSFMTILYHFGRIIPNTSHQLGRVIPNIHVALDHFPVTWTFFVILDSVTKDHVFY